MFRQLLTPVGDSLGLSFLIAILPVVAVLVLLGLLRRPAWQAALAGLIVALIGAVRCVPHLGDHALAERPSRDPSGGRLLLRRFAGGDCRVRHAGRHYQLATDPGG